MRQLRALQPILRNISVNWEDLPVVQKYEKTERKIPPIFDRERLILYIYRR